MRTIGNIGFLLVMVFGSVECNSNIPGVIVLCGLAMILYVAKREQKEIDRT